MSKILNGKELSEEKVLDFSKRINELIKKGINPKLVVIIVGNDPASATYVRNKIKYSNKVKLNSETIELPEYTSEDDLIALITKLNSDDSVHGILVQFPLPKP